MVDSRLVSTAAIEAWQKKQDGALTEGG